MAFTDKYDNTPFTGQKHKLISFRLAIKVLVSRWFPLLIVASIVFLGTSFKYYVSSSKSATAGLSLNYESSTEGLSPNKTRLNISLIKSDEIVEKAIEYAGLTDIVSVSKITSGITITPEYSRISASTDDYYITSRYRISFNQPCEMKNVEAEQFLDLLCEAYKDVFFTEYTSSTAALSSGVKDYSDMEYNEISSDFKLRLNVLTSYLDMRINESSTFVYEKTGDTFKSLQKLVSNLNEYDYKNFNAYIWENGVVKDKTLSLETLAYKNSKLNDEYSECMNEYNIRTEVIEMYENAMTASVLIPTYDDKYEFYMSRTKTGIDDLAKEAEAYLSTAKQIMLDIKTNSDKMEQITSGFNQNQLVFAEDMVDKINTQLNSIEELVKTVDDEYISHKTRNYLTFSARTQSLPDKIHLKRGVLYAFAIFCAMYVFFYLRTVIIQRRNDKKRLFAEKDDLRHIYEEHFL